MKSCYGLFRLLMIGFLFSGGLVAELKGFKKLSEKLGYQSKFIQLKGGGTVYRAKTTSFSEGVDTLSQSKSLRVVPFVELSTGFMWDNCRNYFKSYPAMFKAGVTAHYGHRKNGLKVDYSLSSELNSQHKQLWHTVNDFNITPHIEYIPFYNDFFQLGFKVGVTVCPKLFTSIKRYDIPAAAQQLVAPGVYAMAGDTPQFAGQTYYAKSLQCFGNFGINCAHSPQENMTINFEYYATLGKVHYKNHYYSSKPDDQAFLMSHIKYQAAPDQFLTWGSKPRLKMRAQHIACGITWNF